MRPPPRAWVRDDIVLCGRREREGSPRARVSSAVSRGLGQDGAHGEPTGP
ncbi:hypothetical protein CU044_4675 [Streptomyces sp. L-9-10]|nr:hypothetical protein CU044_4675 [Streptomyces sp. L-9-10]